MGRKAFLKGDKNAKQRPEVLAEASDVGTSGVTSGMVRIADQWLDTSVQCPLKEF